MKSEQQLREQSTAFRSNAVNGARAQKLLVDGELKAAVAAVEKLEKAAVDFEKESINNNVKEVLGGK